MLLVYPKKRKRYFRYALKQLTRNREIPARRYRIPRELLRDIKKARPVMYATKGSESWAKDLMLDFGMNMEHLSNDMDANLNRLMKQILVHMGIPINSVTLHATQSQKKFSEVQQQDVGRYLSAELKIEFTLTINHNVWNIISTLVHECAHHFHQIKGISTEITDYEIFTDFTAMFLGFGKELEKGYAAIQKTERGRDRVIWNRVHAGQVGYLEHRDYVYIRWLLFKYRFFMS